MFTALIPWPWRACCLVLLLTAAGVIGWLDGASHVHKQWDTARAVAAQAVTQQTAHVARVETAQAQVNKEVGNAVQTRIDAVHRYYANRVRQRTATHTGPVPSAPDPAGSADADSADPDPPAAGSGLRAESAGDLAERCAVTTAIALGWQEWWWGIEGAQ